jgi:hypothetical protein
MRRRQFSWSFTTALYGAALISAIVLLVAQNAFSQAADGNIVGSLTDETGAAVPAAIAESPMLATVQSGIDSNLNGDSAGDRVIINTAGDPGAGSGVTPLKNSAGETVGYLAANPNARYISAGLGAYSNGGRSTLPVRGINNFDLSFSKRIPVTEHKLVEIRAEMYNAFNHSQFTPGLLNNTYPQIRTDTRNYLIPFNVDFNNPETAFGNNARSVQMALRFQF